MGLRAAWTGEVPGEAGSRLGVPSDPAGFGMLVMERQEARPFGRMGISWDETPAAVPDCPFFLTCITLVHDGMLYGKLLLLLLLLLLAAPLLLLLPFLVGERLCAAASKRLDSLGDSCRAFLRAGSLSSSPPGSPHCQASSVTASKSV